MLVNNKEMQEIIAAVICNKSNNISCEECYSRGGSDVCSKFKKCRIAEKTHDQLNYVLSPIDKNVFLSACAGSGKTEVVGMKAAYEISRWDKNSRNGIAVLTFTNEAAYVIKDRVSQFNRITRTYPHFIGTFSSFIHQYIAQPFGYCFMNYIGNNGDCSFRIIDKSINNNRNHWLNNYSVYSVSANKTYYDHKTKKYYIFQNHKEFDVKQYYKIISSRGHGNIMSYSEFVRSIKKNKKDFISDGFTNFEDMNYIAYKVLRKSERISSVIAKRFPLIMVDECQDLSLIELKILDILKEKGSTLHLIGDLNQSIYEFKRVDPDDTRDFAKDFIEYKLSLNFRCCKSIVKFTNELVPNCKNIVSEHEDKYGENTLLYMSYEDETDTVGNYIELLKIFDINISKACIIAKQNSVVDKLLKREKCPSLLISAIYLWHYGNAIQKSEALEYAGEEISDWLGGGTSKK